MRRSLGALLFSVLSLAVFAGTPVEDHGALKVSGTKIVDKIGAPVQLAGMSLFWPLWGGERFFNKDVVDTLVSDWNCSLLRAPVGVEPRGGYLTKPGPMKAELQAVVDEAIAKGIYVIIDWHEEHATKHLAQSKAFFEEMAKTYGDKPNVIFEIFNEPVGTSWPQIKAYAEEVIPAIRKYSPNLIVVGTPNWSQRVDQAADDPIAGPNIAYTLHFYAGTHGQAFRDMGDYAISKGLALFITEWGTTHADGGNKDRKLYIEASEIWLKWMDKHQLSWANWSVMDKNESSSALVAPASVKGEWPEAIITPSGRWVKQQIKRVNGIKVEAPLAEAKSVEAK